MGERTVTAENAKLIGSSVLVSGTIGIIKESLFWTPSEGYITQKRYLLKPVRIDGVYYHHLWILGCPEIDHFGIGDLVYFTAKLVTYQHKKKHRISVASPYQNVFPRKFNEPVFNQLPIYHPLKNVKTYSVHFCN